MSYVYTLTQYELQRFLNRAKQELLEDMRDQFHISENLVEEYKLNTSFFVEKPDVDVTKFLQKENINKYITFRLVHVNIKDNDAAQEASFQKLSLEL